MTRDHIIYIAGRRRMPLTLPKEPTREDTLFGYLRRAVPKPHMREQHRNAWISDKTWKLVDEQVSERRGPRVRSRLRRLGRAIKASLKGDRRRRVEEAGKVVEALLGEDTAKGTHEGGHALWRSAAGRAETAHAGTAQERVDLLRDMETC